MQSTNIKSSFYQTRQASAEGPAVPVAVAVAVAQQGLRTGCSSLSLAGTAGVAFTFSHVCSQHPQSLYR